MRKLLICESALQIIIAAMLKFDISQEGDVTDIIITDGYNGSKEIAGRITETNFYNHVYYAETRSILFPQNWREKCIKLYHLFFYGKSVLKVTGSELPDYEEVYAWNYDMFTANIRSVLKKKNPKLQSFVYEEGFISYMPYEKILPLYTNEKIINLRNHLLRIGNVTREDIRGLYLFEPECLMEKVRYPVYQITRQALEKEEFKQFVEYVFNAKKRAEKYNRKYILFEEGFVHNHPEIDDYDLFKKIIDCVGAENVIIKLHPRTKINRFKELGVIVFEADGIPWEAIAFAENMSDKVLIAIGSGSITNCRLMYGSNIESYLLFKFVETHIDHFGPEYDDLWGKLDALGSERRLHIPQSEAIFFDMLRKTIYT